MSKDPHFLSLDQIIIIHNRMIGDFGGAEGVRENGLLESAVSMPSARYAGEFLHKNIAAMAGAYLFHISRNHAFVDGNKRTALASALIFLDVNGYDINAENDELEEITLNAAVGTAGKRDVIRFFKKRIRKQD